MQIDTKEHSAQVRQIKRVVETLISYTECRKATVYVSPDFVAKATRQWKPSKRSKGETFLVTFGKPNYEERRFIKLCQKAGVDFPVRKVQLKWYTAPTR